VRALLHHLRAGLAYMSGGQGVSAGLLVSSALAFIRVLLAEGRA
jgi:hypothetical protein